MVQPISIHPSLHHPRHTINSPCTSSSKQRRPSTRPQEPHQNSNAPNRVSLLLHRRPPTSNHRPSPARPARQYQHQQAHHEFPIASEYKSDLPYFNTFIAANVPNPACDFRPSSLPLLLTTAYAPSPGPARFSRAPPPRSQSSSILHPPSSIHLFASFAPYNQTPISCVLLPTCRANPLISRNSTAESKLDGSFEMEMDDGREVVKSVRDFECLPPAAKQSK